MRLSSKGGGSSPRIQPPFLPSTTAFALVALSTASPPPPCSRPPEAFPASKNKAPTAHRLIEHASLNSWEPQLNFRCIHSRPALVCVMASSATGTPKYVTLVSAEGHCFIVDYKCAMTSKTIIGDSLLCVGPPSLDFR